jgi:hypothetical protein
MCRSHIRAMLLVHGVGCLAFVPLYMSKSLNFNTFLFCTAQTTRIHAHAPQMRAPMFLFRLAAADFCKAHRPWMGVYMMQSAQNGEGAEEELVIDADGIAWGDRRSRPG